MGLFPPCQQFPFGWGVLALEPSSCWVGQGPGEKTVTSRRAHSSEYFPLLPLPVSLSLQWARADPASAGEPPIVAARTGPISYKGSFLFCFVFLWVRLPLRPCMSPPVVEFLFPPILRKSFDQAPLAFKARFSGVFSSHCQTPRLGSLTWVSELSATVELLWYNYFPVCQSPTRWVWCLIFIMIGPLLVAHGVFGCRVSFSVGLFVYFQWLVSSWLWFSWFSQKGVTSSPSTMPFCLHLCCYFSDCFCSSLFSFLSVSSLLICRASLVSQMVKNLPAVQETRGSIPGSARSPGERNGNPLQYSCPWTEEPGGLQTIHGVAESDTTEQLTRFCDLIIFFTGILVFLSLYFLCIF